MPHSSGGGFSGGGFHSGGGSSSGPSYRTSSHYFPGASCWIYYGRGGVMRTLYVQGGDARRIFRAKIASVVGVVLFMLAGVGVALFAGIHNPQKISTSYSTTIVVDDQTNVLNAAEETTLKETFEEFFTVSGICPSFVSVTNATWQSKYASLSGYAYDKYLNMFNDESHWLIVYSDNGGKSNWYFEGMQGNDTDNVLTTQVTDNFNSFLYGLLSSPESSVGQSVNAAFRHIMPTLMDSSFRIDRPVLIFLIVWESILTGLLVVTIVGLVKCRGMKGAVKINGQPVRKQCPNCGNEYAEGTVYTCPKCGTQLSSEKYASFHKHDLY